MWQDLKGKSGKATRLWHSRWCDYRTLQTNGRQFY